MPLESLLELVQTLRQRIIEHRSALSGNEMLTRYALIDPLLSELGWETTDPATVIPEDTSGLGRGRPDYVLQHSGKPVMVIEAKKLGSGLQDGARQAISYAMDANRQARYFALTDGQNWKIYDTNRPASDMRVTSFDIMAVSPAEVCLQALALWQSSVIDGKVSAGQAPIYMPKPQPVTMTPTPPPYTPDSAVQPTDPPTDVSDRWIPLSEYRPASRERPIEIMFPDSTTHPVKYMREVLIETTRWLVRTNNLDPHNQNHCPITGTSRNIISNYPTHPNGDSFENENPEQVEGLWVNTKYPNPQTVRNTCKVIVHVGQDPSQFKIRLPS